MPISKIQAERMREHGFITVTEAARLAGVATQTVYDWLNDGRVDGRDVGRARFVLLASLREHIGEDVFDLIAADG